MSYAGIDNPTIITQNILDLIIREAEVLQVNPNDLYYGDQELIPRFPTICVESGPQESELAGAPMVLLNSFTVWLMVYHTQIGNQQVTKKDCEEFANNVRTVLHSDKTMGDTVIYSFVSNVEPGYAQRANTMLRTTRITWRGQSKVMV